MSFLDTRLFGDVLTARRTFLGAGGLALSGTAVALLAGPRRARGGRGQVRAIPPTTSRS